MTRERISLFVRFSFYAMEYVFQPLLLWLIAVFPGLWWMDIWHRNEKNLLILAVLMLLLLAASVYDVGYKKAFLYGEKRRFYLVFVLPLIAATMGFLYGVLRVYGS